MPLLLAACPSFLPQWEIHQEEEQGNEPLFYLELAEFARHLIGLYQRKETDEFPAIFAVVERLHLEGDPYLQEAATIGFLEGLQNNAEHRDLNPEVFFCFLQPETAKWWQHLNDFWSGKTQCVGGPKRETK